MLMDAFPTYATVSNQSKEPCPEMYLLFWRVVYS